MLIVNLLGIVLIGLIVWWFWLYKPARAVDLNEKNLIIVVNNGVYQPSKIKVEAGKKNSLKFFRKDGSPCAATVIFPDIEISEELPVNSNKTIDLPSLSPGEYSFHCPMKMYKGTLVVD